MPFEPVDAGFRVPAPDRRPGDKPDFSNLAIPRAGDAARPDALAGVEETRDLAYGLIRVLDHNHQAVGAWDPGLSADELREALRYMVLTRVYDDRLFRLQRQGKISFYMKSLGEEAVAVAAAMALSPDDMAFPSYRQQGLLIARGRSLFDMTCHNMANSGDNLKGRQLPVHYAAREQSVFSISGNLTTQFPQAVGWAMASAHQRSDRIASTWIGEGSSAEGDFHSACTMAQVYQAPVLFNVVNNQWAISTNQNIAGGEGATFAARAIGYGFPGLRVDGNDFLAVYAATAWAAARARLGGGPTLLELYTYRGEGHSTSDDPGRYRAANEWSAWPLGDPVDRLKNHLIGIDEWTSADHAQLEKACEAEVTAARKEAEAMEPVAATDTLFEDVYAEPPWHLKRQMAEAFA